MTALRFKACIMVILGWPTMGLAVPRIAVSEPEYNFGEWLDNRELIHHEFQIMNSGDEVLKIERAHSSCGCTTAALPVKELPPGGSMALKVTFDPRGRAGGQIKEISVYSNDPERPRLSLMIKGTVRPSFTVTPPMLYLITQPGQEPVEREMEMRFNGPTRIVRSWSTPEWVTVGPPAGQTSDLHRILIRVAPPADAGGVVHGKVEFDTEPPLNPHPRILVSVQVGDRNRSTQNRGQSAPVQGPR